MTVEIIRRESVKIVFAEHSSWTLWISHDPMGMLFQLCWNNSEHASSERLVHRDTPEFKLLKDFFTNAQGNS